MQRQWQNNEQRHQVRMAFELYEIKDLLLTMILCIQTNHQIIIGPKKYFELTKVGSTKQYFPYS